jgi:lipoprotein NlpI
MRRILIGLVVAFIALPASAQTRDQNVARCNDGSDPDASIAGCTALIQSGQETSAVLAAAYYNRGNSYDGKGLHDQAIADFTQAIAIKPDFSPAYYNRGAAYETKGLRDLAIADYRATLKLDPNQALAADGLKRLGATP